MNKNEYIIYQNLEDAAKAVLRRKFIGVNIYINKGETSKINDLNFQLEDTCRKNSKLNLMQAEGRI